MDKQNTPPAFKIEHLYSDILRDYQIRLEKEEKVGRIPPNKSEDIIKVSLKLSSVLRSFWKRTFIY